MKQKGSIELFQYWDRLRGKRSAPKRSEIEPGDIKSLLADTFILELDERQEPVFRLAGTRLCATYGRELKGASLPSLWGDRDRAGVSRVIGNAFRSSSVLVIDFNGVSRDGRSNPFELIILPLDGIGAAPRALGAILPCAKPYWLGADPVLVNMTESLRIIDADREPFFLANRPSVPFPASAKEERIQSQRPPATGARRFRHLMVFDGGRQ